MNDTEKMTDRSRQIMQALLDRADEWLSVAEVSEDTKLGVGTVGPLLGRLISFGFVEDRRAGNNRFYRVIPEQVDAARQAMRTSSTVGMISAAPKATAQVQKVWTLTELEEAVEAGEMPEGLLIKAREVLKPRRR